MPFDRFLPRPFTASAIRSYAPAESGVYGLSNAREWVYIGECDNIQAALLNYLQSPDSEPMRKHPTGFVCEVCGLAARPARQDRLILEYEPTCNRMPTQFR